MLFIMCVKRQNFERWLKNGTVFVKKASIMLMTSSEKGNVYYFKSNFFSLKQYFVLNVSAKFE